MPCNGWNHSSQCNCGWGGMNHGGGGGRWPALVVDGYGRDAWESFVNPNALCPVCGAEVFYYQSPDGGRVFFNHLGWPWPKHPCTDNSDRGRSPAPGVLVGSRPPSREPWPWEIEGWAPVFHVELVGARETLLSAKVWTGLKPALQEVHWRLGAMFPWEGVVMVRRAPNSRYLLEFETVVLQSDEPTPIRLLAVQRDPAVPFRTLLHRLSEKR